MANTDIGSYFSISMKRFVERKFFEDLIKEHKDALFAAGEDFKEVPVGDTVCPIFLAYRFTDIDGSIEKIYGTDEDHVETTIESLSDDLIKVNADHTCPITLEIPPDPVVFNLDGYVYSKEALMKAITNTLFVGLNLNLPEVTVLPEMIPNIRICSTDNVLELSNEFVPSYNGEKIDNNSFPEFSQWMHEIPKTEDGIWDAEWLYRKYIKKRGMNICNTIEPIWVVQDMRIDKCPMVKHHPKMNSGTFIFRNCHFVDCQWLSDCWCGIKFVACRFSGSFPTGSGSRIRMVNCVTDISNPRSK